MADGGASNMILLVTALLICGAASGILLQSWSQTATSVGINQEQLALNSKTKKNIKNIKKPQKQQKTTTKKTHKNNTKQQKRQTQLLLKRIQS